MSRKGEPSYSLEHVQATVAGDPKHLEVWIEWLRNNGLRPDGSITESQAVAIAAGARFTEANVSKVKITKLVRKLVRTPPEAGSDWVAVERPRVKDIEIEPGPFEGGMVKPNQRLPIVFDPYTVLERLRAK